jgi:hypothetical protein
VTQPPILTADGPAYTDGASFEALVPYPRRAPHRYSALPGAWRLGVEVAGGDARFPWRASLAADSLARTYNRANLYVPARPGEARHALVIFVPNGAVTPVTAVTLRVALLEADAPRSTVDVSVDSKEAQGAK